MEEIVVMVNNEHHNQPTDHRGVCVTQKLEETGAIDQSGAHSLGRLANSQTDHS
jgi:hypothetical protein